MVKLFFDTECKTHGVEYTFSTSDWFAKGKSISIPPQKTQKAIFFGFHELAHAILHDGDERDYDCPEQRALIEIEADELANDFMVKYGFRRKSNNMTYKLILNAIVGGSTAFAGYSVKEEDYFYTLYRSGKEAFSAFK